MPPLSITESKEIVNNICKKYHRVLNPQVIQTLFDKKNLKGNFSYANPLWLNLAIEELNLLDADDFSLAEQEFEGTSKQKLFQFL